jgi:hypothetical protein
LIERSNISTRFVNFGVAIALSFKIFAGMGSWGVAEAEAEAEAETDAMRALSGERAAGTLMRSLRLG